MSIEFARRPSFVVLLLSVLVACEGGDEGASVATDSAAVAVAASAPRTWIHPYRGDVEIDGVTSDARSDVYAAGYFVGLTEFAPGYVLESVADAKGKPTKDIFVTKHARADGALAWARHFGGAGAEGNAYDLTFADGLVIASGAFSGDVDFDGTMLTSTVSAGTGSASSGTYGNMFLAALDDAGRAKWAIQATGDVLSGGNEVAPAPNGGFVQVGMFGGTSDAGGTLEIDGRSLAFTGGFFDTYAAKLDSAGHVSWIRRIGGSGAQRGKAIATDAKGNVLVAGDAWSGETRFGRTSAFTSDDQQDFWIAKYDPQGDLVWFRSASSSGFDEVKGIAADAKGNVIVAAAFTGPSLRLADGPKIDARPGATNTGIVFMLSADGASVLWANTIASVGKCCEIEIDQRGHTFAASSGLAPSVRYGDGTDFAIGGSPRGALLTELDGSGARVGSWTLTGDAGELGELTLLAGGGVAIAGSFLGGALRFGDLEVSGGSTRTQYVLAIGTR
jgi:hypothetical protein